MADGAEPVSDDWWVAWPGLYTSELEAYVAHGAQVSIVHRARAILVLEVLWPAGEGAIRLTVGYSPTHPFARPSVVAPDLRLGRHQNPLDQGLCLITQGSGEWRSGQRVADYIAEQLKQVLAANEARDGGRLAEAAQMEEQAPDPLASYYDYLAEEDSAIFYSADQLIPKGDAGFAVFEASQRAIAPAAFEAVLRTLSPLSGAWLAKPFPMPLSGTTSLPIEGRWVRLRPPATDDPGEILAAAEAEVEKAAALRPQLSARLKAIGEQPSTITALLFDDELEYGARRDGVGWLFVKSVTDPATGQRHHSLVRGFRISDDLQVRVPVAAGLRGKRALLVGVGAIGSFAALEFARAGVGKLHIVDFDVVEPGNSVRWPLGRPVWGLRKVLALRDFIHRNYPGTRVDASNFRLGGATTDASSVPADMGNLLSATLEMIDEADVVIDASASTECQEALAYYCRARGKPLVIGYATEGAAGGVVARFPPDAQACYVCLQERWRDEDFPKPAVDPRGSVVPVGCNQPTFTGAAFDLQEVSLEMVRSAVGLMVPDAYDPGDWQVAVLSLRRNGRRCPPSWEIGNLAPKCAGCTRA